MHQANKTPLHQTLQNIVKQHEDDLSPSIKQLLEALSKADILEEGDKFIHLNKEQVIELAGAKALSDGNLRKRILMLNSFFEAHNIPAKLNSRKSHFELNFDQELLSLQQAEDAALSAARQSNSEDYQEPEAMVLKRKVFVSHKWIDKDVMALTEEFISKLEQQLSYPNKAQLEIELFCDLSDRGGFNFHEIQAEQQDKHCQEADLILILWSEGYEQSKPCLQERSFFLDEEANTLEGKTAIAILEYGRFEDMPDLMKKRILFTHPKRDMKSLISFWEKAGHSDKLEYVSALRDAIIDAFTTPPIPSPKKPLLEDKLHKANQKQLTQAFDRDNLTDTCQTPEGFHDNSRSSEKRLKVIPHLVHWANQTCDDTETPRLTALLGDFGFGKTVTCRLFAQQLGTEYQKDRTKPLPIYLDLKALMQMGKEHLSDQLSQPIEFLIETMLKQTGEAEIDGKSVIQLMRQKPCVLIFDGFDEIGQHLDKAAQQVAYKKLLDLIPYEVYRNDNLRLAEKEDYDPSLTFPSKLLISCRTHFFNRFQEESSFLTGNDRLTVSEKNLQRLYMAPFKTEAIQGYLRSALGEDEGERAYQMLGDIHDLSELSSHPIMLKLICQQVPKLEQIAQQGRHVNSATLYLNLFGEINQRDREKHIISLSAKQKLLARLALIMWLKRTTYMSYSKLEDWFEEFANAHPTLKNQISGDLDRFEKMTVDLVNATLLVRDNDDDYRFAHTSYLEFFRALGLFEAVKNGELTKHIQTTKALRHFTDARTEKVLDKDTLQFFYNWWQTCDEEDKLDFSDGFIQLLEQPNSLLEKRLSFDIWRFCQLEFFKQKEQQAFPHSHQLDWSGLAFTKDFIPSELRTLSLAQANLQDCYFHLVRFDRLNLTQANFNRSKIYQCYFHQCETAQAQWQGVDELNTTLPSPTSKISSATGTQRLQTNLGHSDSVYCIAVLPDEEHFLSASEDCTIKLWHIESGECLQTFSGHDDEVNSIALSPDGKSFLSASSDETIKLWNANPRSTNCLQTFYGHENRVNFVVFSPDGKHFLSASSDHTIKLWQVNSTNCLQTFNEHDAVTSVIFSPDGKHFLSASFDHTIKLRHIDSTDCLQTFNGHDEAVSSITFSPDGKHFLSASYDHTIKLWHIDSTDYLQTFNEHEDGVNSVIFSPDGQHFLSASFDQTIKLWHIETLECLQTFNGHQGSILSIASFLDGKRFLSASSNGTIKLWNSAALSIHCQKTYNGRNNEVLSAAFSPNNKLFLAAGLGRTIRLWNTASLSLDYLHTSKLNQSIILSIAFSPNGKHFLHAGTNGMIDLWSADSHLEGKVQTFNSHEDWVQCVTFSPDSQHFLSASKDKTIKLWHIDSPDCLQTFNDHNSWIQSVAFSNDSKHFLSASYDKTIKLWHIDSIQCLQTFHGHSGRVLSVVFSNDGKHFISASDDQTIKLWHTNSSECLHTFNGHDGIVSSITFSPDGKYFLSASDDRTIKLWSVDPFSNDYLQTFYGHQGSILSISFYPDGKQFLSASYDGTIKRWDIESGLCISTITQTPEGYIVSQLGENGVEQVVRAQGDAWQYLTLHNLEDAGDVRPAYEAENWQEIYIS